MARFKRANHTTKSQPATSSKTDEAIQPTEHKQPASNYDTATTQTNPSNHDRVQQL